MWSRWIGYDIGARHEPFFPASAFFGHVDVPRLEDGGIGAQFFGLVSLPVARHGHVRAIDEQIDALEAHIASGESRLCKIRSAEDVERVHREGMTGALLGQSLPGFFVGIVLILIFSYWLGILPSYGAYSTRDPLWGSVVLDGLWHMVLPVGMLAFFNTATLTLLMRANLVDILRHDFIVAARASGLPERTVVYRHAVRNAVIPLLTYLGLLFGLMLGTAPVTETVFTWPGLGYLYITAIQQLDYPVIMGESMLITIMLVTATLLTDVAYVLIDPRIRLE